MWLDNLKELKAQSKMSSKQIGDKAALPERTVSRIFSGATHNPQMTTVRAIANALGTTLDDLFAEGSAIVGGNSMQTLQEKLTAVQTEKDILQAENGVLKEQIAALTAQVAATTNEATLLRMQLQHKDELIAVYKSFTK